MIFFGLGVILILIAIVLSNSLSRISKQIEELQDDIASIQEDINELLPDQDDINL